MGLREVRAGGGREIGGSRRFCPIMKEKHIIKLLACGFVFSSITERVGVLHRSGVEFSNNIVVGL